jgi:hypothetical protein
MVLERWRPGWGLRSWRPFRELEEKERRFEEASGQLSLTIIWRKPILLRRNGNRHIA